MNVLTNMPYDLVMKVFDYMELKHADLKALSKGFPVGGYHRAGVEYRAETQRLLEERYAYYLMVAKSSWYALDYVPEELRDREMCLEAVKSDGSALRYVPGELCDREICLEAVKRDGYALGYVPEELRY